MSQIADGRKGKCLCCGGTGRVLTATNVWRPCSRCNGAAYEEWAARYFVPQPAEQVQP